MLWRYKLFYVCAWTTSMVCVMWWLVCTQVTCLSATPSAGTIDRLLLCACTWCLYIVCNVVFSQCIVCVCVCSLRISAVWECMRGQRYIWRDSAWRPMLVSGVIHETRSVTSEVQATSILTFCFVLRDGGIPIVKIIIEKKIIPNYHDCCSLKNYFKNK